MSKRTDQEFLNDIREALKRIAAYIAGTARQASNDSVEEYGCRS